MLPTTSGDVIESDLRDVSGFRGQRSQHSQGELKREHEEAAAAQAILKLDPGSWGADYRPIHLRVTTSDRHSDEYIKHSIPFKGTWQTDLTDKKLLVPLAWQPLFKYGGVVAPGIGHNLMMFAGRHWGRMVNLMGEQVGLKMDKNALIRHIYGRHMSFEHLDSSGAVTLTDDLIAYARLDREIVAVGLIYFGEVYSKEEYEATIIEPENTSKLPLPQA